MVENLDGKRRAAIPEKEREASQIRCRNQAQHQGGSQSMGRDGRGKFKQTRCTGGPM